ncbi:ralA-binding protein 1-like isoform X1 [Bolinopsis microptera]|uniref:ralA-binding protein 1-like isoform X1 n=1 Tax=Bolinopsis microptera TaxID=2820187 RepID=UPI003079392A
MVNHCNGNVGCGKYKLVPTMLCNLNEAMDNVWRNRKKNKKKLRKFITSVYSERTPEKPAAPAQSKGPVFGMPLVTAVQRSRVSDKLPLCRVFQDSVMYIETFALTREGIYRVPGFRAKLNELKNMYNRGEVVKLTNYDPETVGMLLKLYLRELPEPLLTRQLGAQFEGVLQYEDSEQRTAILCAMLRQLPAEHYATLAWLCLHINHVSQHEKQNKMTLSNLIIILSPTLLISNTLLRCLCENAQQLFPGVILDPNTKIPTQEELNALSNNSNKAEPEVDQASIDKNLQLVRDELVQSYVWVQARNDALRYMKEHLKAQLKEERQMVSTYQDQLRDLEDQNYTIGDTVVLRNSRRGKSQNRHSAADTTSRNLNSTQAATHETEEDLKLYLSTLEQMNNEYETDKTSLYNNIITDTFACIDAYTELRFRQTFSQQKASS